LKKSEQAEENQLENVAKSLLQDHIFKNKDESVRLIAACCLADVIRIYAPNSPYDDEQTKVSNNDKL
jgi:sister-chromatid-cohesion protein PDS5